MKANRPPIPGTVPLNPATGERSNTRNIQILDKKYKFNNILTSNRQIQDAVADAWYEVIFDLTRDARGKGPRRLTQADKENRVYKEWPTNKMTDFFYMKGKNTLEDWKWPRRKKGWKSKCWQFAGTLLTVLNNRLGRPYGLLPVYDLGPTKKGQKFPKSPRSWLRINNTNVSGQLYGFCGFLEKVTTPNGRLFGQGLTLVDLGKLGILPGMAVHVSIDWDKPNKKGSPCYSNIKNACNHWVVYAGYKNGKHYYCDSRGINPAYKLDNWMTNTWAQSYFKKTGWEQIRNYIKKKYGKKLTWGQLKKIDSYSANVLVRAVYTPFPLESMGIEDKIAFEQKQLIQEKAKSNE